MMARLLDIPRSLAFYAAFYGGSVPIVLSAVVLLLLGSQRRFRIAVHAWSGWHRVCARWLLGQRLRIEGALPEGPVMVAVKHESFFEAIDLPTLLPLPGVVEVHRRLVAHGLLSAQPIPRSQADLLELLAMRDY